MTYGVIWRPPAEQKLAQIWNESGERKAVAESANLMDQLLSSTPLEVGESRAGRTRILTVMPLSIFYDVYDDDHLVAVWAVWIVQTK
jgi:plasmid stabilization system protein ParE